jgi:uncharacterized protein with PQ loop repeat
MSLIHKVKAEKVPNIRLVSTSKEDSKNAINYRLRGTDQLKTISIKEEYSTDTWKVYYSKFMIFWAVVSHVWLLIQAINIYSKKSSENISLAAFIILLCSSIFWFIYGFQVIPGKNKIIMLSASVSFVLGIIVIIGIIMYA